MEKNFSAQISLFIKSRTRTSMLDGRLSMEGDFVEEKAAVGMGGEDRYDEEVRAWSWGAASDGQLGMGTVEDQLLPQALLNFPPLSSSPATRRITQIACGGAHSIALTGDGRVLTWGRGTCGQLGHQELSNCLLPKPVKFLESFTISYVSAGWNHSGFVTDAGRLFMCGDGSFGQLGNGDHQSHGSPVEVLFFSSKHVEQIACGMRHSLALVSDAGSSGSLIYGFGSARHGQIGMLESRTQRSHNFPKVIEGFENCEIVSIYANGDHSAALSADGQLYIWGRRFSGRSDDHIPQILPSPLGITEVALGWNHALVLTDNGVYMFGGYRHGMLSGSPLANPIQHALFPSAQAPTLEKVPCLDDEKVVHIAAGAEHSALITDKGTIMTWGWGEHGQLGLGNTCDQTSPQIVNIDCKRSSTSVQLGIYCGSGFTIVVKSTLSPTRRQLGLHARPPSSAGELKSSFPLQRQGDAQPHLVIWDKKKRKEKRK
ncbi:ultraviolet-B receptor UVR8 isoform X2 [Elaeis guineensis]|uniref:Ultraviolet-B receptor UVR8 isoform X2 n=1 Tax=Elaeis guineensis var. tenera TaxID=51953 RepID=A0A6J0PGU3_ELAGV|nr:ultraviolet-B receptor UVR8 isoform X2 [Elaeis guineensis]